MTTNIRIQVDTRHSRTVGLGLAYMFTASHACTFSLYRYITCDRSLTSSGGLLNITPKAGIRGKWIRLEKKTNY